MPALVEKWKATKQKFYAVASTLSVGRADGYTRCVWTNEAMTVELVHETNISAILGE